MGTARAKRRSRDGGTGAALSVLGAVAQPCTVEHRLAAELAAVREAMAGEIILA